ncbi:MAG: hypothetical protein PVI23_07495 [Maricaulaceae bacterium]|jgi:hypothetical protein
MDKQRFLACLEAYGADVARWPEDERAAARALMRAAPAAQSAADSKRGAEPGSAPADTAQAIAETRALDQVLAEAPEQAVNAALLGRVLASAPQPRSVRASGGGLAGVLGGAWSAAGLAGVLDGARPRAAMSAACLLLAAASVYAGWTASRVVTETAAEDAFISALYADSYDGLFTDDQLTNQLSGAELDG